jgi:NAD(P)-dependent dehydrogenase (short-subunit alcohol dehydrogenase family)
VTGGNSGTGYATCKAFYERGATVYMASRSKDRADEAIKAIESGHDLGINNTVIQRQRAGNSKSGEIIFLKVDLTDLNSVEEMIQELKQ